MKIILVDDEQRFVSTLAQRLCLRGIEADWTCSGEEALDMAGRTKYDLAVLDVKMPGIGGIELKRRLEALAPHLKYIFLTGHGSDDDFAVGSAEASSYLAKPIKIEVVIEKIHEALGPQGGEGGEGGEGES
jgi:DNA-binding response OmpR family regulator